MAIWFISNTNDMVTFSRWAFWPEFLLIKSGFYLAYVTSRKISIHGIFLGFAKDSERPAEQECDRHPSSAREENILREEGIRNMWLLTKHPAIWRPSVPSWGFSGFVLEDATEVWIWEAFLDVVSFHPSSLGSTMPKLYQRDGFFSLFLDLSMSPDKLTGFSTRKHFL